MERTSSNSSFQISPGASSTTGNDGAAKQETRSNLPLELPILVQTRVTESQTKMERAMKAGAWPDACDAFCGSAAATRRQLVTLPCFAEFTQNLSLLSLDPERKAQFSRTLRKMAGFQAKRGQGPEILESILRNCPNWVMPNVLKALGNATYANSLEEMLRKHPSLAEALTEGAELRRAREHRQVERIADIGVFRAADGRRRLWHKAAACNGMAWEGFRVSPCLRRKGTRRQRYDQAAARSVARSQPAPGNDGMQHHGERVRTGARGFFQ